LRPVPDDPRGVRVLGDVERDSTRSRKRSLRERPARCNSSHYRLSSGRPRLPVEVCRAILACVDSRMGFSFIVLRKGKSRWCRGVLCRRTKPASMSLENQRLIDSPSHAARQWCEESRSCLSCLGQTCPESSTLACAVRINVPGGDQRFRARSPTCCRPDPFMTRFSATCCNYLDRNR
jgi:hypothetical protein